MDPRLCMNTAPKLPPHPKDKDKMSSLGMHLLPTLMPIIALHLDMVPGGAP